MNVLSLFSGVGGMDMGLERAGHTIVGMCEIDKQARRVLRRHWPDVPLMEDVTNVRICDCVRLPQQSLGVGHQLLPNAGHESRPSDSSAACDDCGGIIRGRVDLVAGGSPCQDLSVAGRRAGLDGQRSSLFWHQCRIADSVAAPLVLWENVAGAFSSNNGADFAAVLWGITGALPDVPDGGWRNMGICIGPKRTAVWRLLDARWFGVAQRRRRVFVVGGPTDGSWIEVLLEPESCDRDSRPSTTPGTGVAALTSTGVGTCGADDNQAQAGHLVPTSFRFVGGAQQDEIVTADQQVGALTHASNSHMGNHQPKVMVPFVKVVRSGARDADGNLPPEVWRDEQTAPTLNAMDNGGESRATVLAVSELYEPASLMDENWKQTDVKASLRAEASAVSHAIATDLAVRRLTPVECERLMGWPDNWTRYADDGSEIADSHRYRMCGNGVVSNVTEWIGRRLP